MQPTISLLALTVSTVPVSSCNGILKMTSGCCRKCSLRNCCTSSADSIRSAGNPVGDTRLGFVKRCDTVFMFQNTIILYVSYKVYI